MTYRGLSVILFCHFTGFTEKLRVATTVPETFVFDTISVHFHCIHLADADTVTYKLIVVRIGELDHASDPRRN